MTMAMREAGKANRAEEVPVGAVVLLAGRVVGRGHNLTRKLKDPTAHAEILAIRDASRNVGQDRLVGAELYSTLEPCPMCAGAIVHARISRLVYGADDPKAGACGSVMRVIPNRNLNHRPDVVKRVLAGPCGALLSDFFRARRAAKKGSLTSFSR